MSDNHDTRLSNISIQDQKRVQELREHLGDLLKASGYGERHIVEIQVALEEAIMNATLHGNGGGTAKRVLVAYHVDSNKAWIRVEDEGTGFDVASVPDPRLPENLAKPHGRGLFLMRSFMDRVEYNERGNVVAMTRFQANTPAVTSVDTERALRAFVAPPSIRKVGHLRHVYHAMIRAETARCP